MNACNQNVDRFKIRFDKNYNIVIGRNKSVDFEEKL